MPDDWCGRWNGDPATDNRIAAVRRALIGGFALPIEISDSAKGHAYQKWIEEITTS